MKISLRSVLESLASFFSRVPASVNYTLLVLLQGLLYLGSPLADGRWWIALLIAIGLSGLIGPAGVWGIILHLYIIGCIAGALNILGFKAAL